MSDNVASGQSASQSAKIYAFPPRGRFAIRQDDAATAAPYSELPRGLKIAAGSGWYHEEAVRAERTGDI